MPQPAVRMTQRSAYKNPSALRYLNYKEIIGWELQRFRPPLIAKEDVYIRVQFHFKAKCRADIDNLFKGFTDAANGILWDDDRQIKRTAIAILENEPVEGISFSVMPLRDFGVKS